MYLLSRRVVLRLYVSALDVDSSAAGVGKSHTVENECKFVTAVYGQWTIRRCSTDYMKWVLYQQQLKSARH